MPFTFTAPAPAGDHTIRAECADNGCGTDTGRVWVGIKGLVSLYDTHLYRLVGSDGYHPRNHYLTLQATGQAVWLAELYKAEFPGDPILRYNDASLERGGLFDNYYDYVDDNGFRRERNADGWWTPPHETHRLGNIIDVRANPAVHPDTSIPARNFEKFVELACETGGVAEPHSRGTRNQHYHVKFTGCKPKVNARSIEAALSPPGSETPPASGPEPVPSNPCAGPNPDLTLCF